MNRLEKVIKGLECCIATNKGPLCHDCGDCPYAVVYGTCIAVMPLMEDALKELKDYQGKLDIQTEKLAKTESQFRAMCDLSNMQIDTLHEQEQTIEGLENALDLIADIAYDYDGYNTAEGLKSLIDEIREIAIKGVPDEDEGC